MRNPNTENYSGWPDPIDDHTLRPVTELGPQPGQRSPSNASHSLQTLQQDGVVYGVEGCWEIQENKQTADPSIQTSVDVILDSEQRRLRAMPKSVGWLHGVMEAMSWWYRCMRRQLSGNHLLNHLVQKWKVRNGAEVPESVDTQVSSRSGWSQPSWGRQAPLTTPKTHWQHAACEAGQNPALPTPSAGGLVPGPACTARLQSPGSACTDLRMSHWRSCQESVHRGRDWLLHQGWQLLMDVIQSGADSSHLAVEELHEAVSQFLLPVMGWQRPGGCAGQETVDDFIRVTWRWRGNGGSEVVESLPHSVLLATMMPSPFLDPPLQYGRVPIEDIKMWTFETQLGARGGSQRPWVSCWDLPSCNTVMFSQLYVRFVSNWN